MEKQVEEKLFVGGMNQDDSQNLVGIHEYLSARNVLITSPATSGDGEVQNIAGTLSIFDTCTGQKIDGTVFSPVINYSGFSLSIASGSATYCLGSKEDIVKNRIYWFIRNEFNSGSSIRSSIFYYDYNINKVFQIALDLNNSILQLGTGNDPANFIHSIDFIHLSSGDTMLCWCQNGQQPRELHVERSMTNYTANGTTSNWGSPIQEYILDIKRPPSRGPVPYKTGNDPLTKNMGMDNDGTSTKSFEFDGCQFSTRYVYYNGNTSTWSSCSAYFANKLVDIGYFPSTPIPVTNRIRVDLRDPLMWTSYTQGNNITPDTYSGFKSQFIDLIQYIEISFREDYNLPWKFVDRLDFASNYNTPNYVFKAQGNYVALANAETDQAFDLTPEIALTVKIAKNKKIYAAITEDFNFNPAYIQKFLGKIINQDASATTVYQKCYPPNSNYSIGVEFFDEFGRTSSIYANDSTVLKTGNFSALVNTFNCMKIVFTFGVSGTDYPSWAKGFRIKRSENNSSSFFARGLVNNFQYVRGYVSDAIKNYTVDDSISGTFYGRDTFYITDGKEPKDILPGDKVFGSYTSNTATDLKFIEDGSVVVQVFRDLEGASQVWKIQISKPIDANGIYSPSVISFQSLGVQPASYITNQLNGTPVPQVTEVGTAERAHQNANEFGSATQGTFGIGQLGGLIIGAIRYSDADNERLRQINAQNAFLDRRNYDEKVAQSYLNADFQIGNPLYMHSAFYPTGAQKTSPNCKGTLGQWGVSATDFECKELHVEIGNWFKNEYGLPYIWQDGDLVTITIARNFIDIPGATFSLGATTVTCTSNTSLAVGQTLIGRGFQDGTTVSTVNTPGAVTSFTINLSTTTANSGTYQIEGGYADLQSLSSTILVDLKIKNTRGNTLIIDCPSGYNPFSGTYENRFFNTQTEISIRRPIINNQQYLQYYDIGQTFYLPFSSSVYLGSVPGATNLTEGGTLSGDNLNYMGDGDTYLYSAVVYGNSDIISNKSEEDFGPNLAIAGVYMTPNINKRTYYWDKDLGRASIVLQNKEKQVTRNQLIRWSLLYSQNSNINDTNRFIYSNQIEIPIDWGNIIKLAFGQNRLVILCDREIGTAFVDENLIAVDADTGQERIAVAKNTINNPRKLDGQYGCTNPESVINYNNDIYWVSRPKGKAVMYSDYVGINPIISVKADSYFYKIRNNPNLIFGGYDPQNGQLLFSVTPNYSISGFGGEVFSFDTDQLKKWISFYDYRPEAMAYMNNDFFSFKNGILYKHGSSTTYGNIYGNSVVASVSVVFNKEPSSVKMFKVMTQRGNALWVTPVNGIDCDNLNSNGLMQTDILANQWELINNEYWADVLFDKNTPGTTNTDLAKYNGDPMIGKILRVTLQNSDSTLAKVFTVSLVSDVNKRTNN